MCMHVHACMWMHTYTKGIEGANNTSNALHVSKNCVAPPAPCGGGALMHTSPLWWRCCHTHQPPVVEVLSCTPAPCGGGALMHTSPLWWRGSHAHQPPVVEGLSCTPAPCGGGALMHTSPLWWRCCHTHQPPAVEGLSCTPAPCGGGALMHTSPLWWRCSHAHQPLVVGLSMLPLHIEHSKQSHGFSIGAAHSHVLCAIRIHARLYCSNTVIT